MEQKIILKTFYSSFLGVEQGTLLSCVNDIAAATQHTVASHIAKRTHRAILFCKAKGLLPSCNPTLVSELMLLFMFTTIHAFILHYSLKGKVQDFYNPIP